MKVWLGLLLIGFGFIYAGIWTRWLLEDRLLQTGFVTLALAVAVFYLEKK